MKVTTADMAKGALAAAMLVPCMISGNASAAEWTVTARAGASVNTDVEGFSLPEGDAYGLGIERAVGEHFFLSAGVDRLSTELPFAGANGVATVYTLGGGVTVPVGAIDLRASAEYAYANTSVDFPFGGADGSGDGLVLAVGATHDLSSRTRIGVEYRRYDFNSDLGGADLGIQSDAVMATFGVRL